MGAGDELLVTGMCREAQVRDPRKVRIEYEKGKFRWSEFWDYNPRIAKRDEVGDFQTLRPRENYLRPYCSEKTPERWTWKAYKPPRGELYLQQWEQAFGNLNPDCVILEPNIKSGASPNKRWPMERWDALARSLLETGIKTIQIGAVFQNPLPGTRYVQTKNMREVAGLVARSRGVVCHEGGLHHVAAAVGTPAVVIFGGYISPEVTGYDDQVSLYTGGEGLGCGMRVTCQHCADAMDKIDAKTVRSKILGVMR